MRNKFLELCPYGEIQLNKLVSDCKKDIFLVLSLAVIILTLWNGMFPLSSELYVTECFVLAVYLVCMEVPNVRIQEIENRMYREMLLYFSRVKHKYSSGHSIANAVVDASKGMQYEICRLAEEIYRVLMEADRKENIRAYALHGRINRYMKLFLIQAYEVSEKGDRFFEENIEYLRVEIMEELYRRRRRFHEFSGYVFVAVAPFFLMPVLKQWGIDFSPEMQQFYSGTGILLEGFIFYITLLVYGMIQRAKEISLFGEQRSTEQRGVHFFFENRVADALCRRMEKREGIFGKRIRQLLLEAQVRMRFGQFCLRMILFGVMVPAILSIFFTEIHTQKRNAILERVDAIESIAPIAGEQKKTAIERHILAVTRQCITGPDYTEQEILQLFRERIHLENSTMEQAAVQEIQYKLQQYDNAKWTVQEILICLCCSIFAGMIPILKLTYEAQAIKKGAVYEIRQFQSIILMERKLAGVTVVGLLEDMEIFSVCFRSCLSRCINSYGADTKGALELLKKDGSKLHEGFEELADAFLAVDDVGVERAFAEVESNRRLLEKMSQLEAEIHMERNKDITELLAKLPMVLAAGGYFILPFFLCSLRGVQEVFELLDKM